MLPDPGRSVLPPAAPPANPPLAPDGPPWQGASGAWGRFLAGGRLHLQHGPIDLVIGAEGAPAAVDDAHRAAWQAFDGLLPGLVAHLALLRRELPIRTCAAYDPGPMGAAPADDVARIMLAACAPYRDRRVTPMAAVAGSVAARMAAVYAAAGVRRAWVNNGGDIAVHLAPGESVRIAIADGRPADRPVTIAFHDPVRGVATSGWRGRSFSLGIADAVTVLAADAAGADVAATLIGNAVDVAGAPVRRTAARALSPDSDLGDRPVTVAVGRLTDAQCDAALAAGAALARDWVRAGRIVAVRIALQSRVATVG